MTTPQAVAPVPAVSAVAALTPAWHRMMSGYEPFLASQRNLSRMAAEAAGLSDAIDRVRSLSTSVERVRSLAERITAEARREVAEQYRRALLARAAQARNAQDRRASLARRALREQGPTLTYLLALNGDADALETLTERARSDAFAAEVLAAVEAVEESSRALALTVWAVAVSLTYLATVEALAGRWANPRPSRTPDLLRYSLDRVAPPASASRIAGRPPVISATAEADASPSTPVQEYRRIET